MGSYELGVIYKYINDGDNLNGANDSIDVFIYHSKLIVTHIRLILVQGARSIVTNKLVWVYEVFDLGWHKKWIVWRLCKFIQPKEISIFSIVGH